MPSWKVKFFSKKKDRLERAKSALVALPEKLKPFSVELQFFDHQDSLKMSFQGASENLLVFDLESLPGKLSEFVSEIKDLSKTEPFFLAMVESAKVEPLMVYQPHGFLNPFTLAEPFGPRLVWHMESALRLLHFSRQDNQLGQELSSLKAAQQKLQEQFEGIHFKQEWEELAFFQLSELVQAKAIEQAMGQFQKALLVLHEKLQGRQPPSSRVGVFEFLATLNSFALTWSFPFAQAGQSFQLTAAEAQRDLAEMNEIPTALKDLGWPDQGRAYFMFKGGLPRFLVVSHFEGAYREFFQALVEAFKQKLNDLLEAQNRGPILDPVTQLPLQESYFLSLDMEIARAQRLGHPLSLIKLHLDHVVELEQALGRVGLQSVIQQVVKLIQGTGRVNDLYFRTQDFELSLILPHCSHKGAAIRAERIRLMIEKHSFLNLGQRITVSQGISTFPSRANSAVELDVTASKALDIARGYSGERGNRICLSAKLQEGVSPKPATQSQGSAARSEFSSDGVS